MNTRAAVMEAIRAFEGAGLPLPAEIQLATDAAWDQLLADLREISHFGGAGLGRPGRIKMYGVEITCPRIVQGREQSWFQDGRRDALDSYGPQMVRSELEKIGIGG